MVLTRKRAKIVGSGLAFTGGLVLVLSIFREQAWQLGVVIGAAFVFSGMALREAAIRRNHHEAIDHRLRHVRTYRVGGADVRASSRENAERVAARAARRRPH